MKTPRSRLRHTAGRTGRHVTTREAVLRLLAPQHAVIQHTVAGASRGNADSLHDLRAAVRRVRCLLRVFQEAFPGAMRLGRSLGRLNQELGQHRDLDVWIALLDRLGRKATFSSLPAWDAFLQSQIRARELQLPRARRILRCARFRAASRALANLPHSVWNLPKVQRELSQVAARRLHDLLRRLRVKNDWLHDSRPQVIHAARKRFRRVRYLAEFFAPALGSAIQALAGELHAVEQHLGRAHDMDRAAAFLQGCSTQVRPLARQIRKRRRKALARAKADLKCIRWVKVAKALSAGTKA